MYARATLATYVLYSYKRLKLVYVPTYRHTTVEVARHEIHNNNNNNNNRSNK